ncbi:hypothetical protein M2366_001887 [Aeromonas sp. BIGb0405]|uniref:hypothetical protein n=1 Tax=Aeromonas sp. BIGb0405 TaxID=2940592 RepID=UPI002166D8F7|nr:hypothetical protein [Aeromonas sp. BIGb0405]MCS3455806.1 hypothetical protein [Aeromonas sp. BIGb0405]
MYIFLPLLMIIIKIMMLLCWWSDNTLRQKERDEAISRLKEQGMTADVLSDTDLVLLRKIYRRRFIDGTIYQHEGIYNIRQLAPGWRQRWQDTCVGDLRVESIYWPAPPSSKDESHTVDIRGIIYKDALYAISADDALFIPEAKRLENLPRQWVPREFDVVYLEGLHFIMPLFSLFTFIASLSSSIPMLSILTTLILGMLGAYLWLIQKQHRLFLIEGKCSLMSANSAFGERKIINECMVSDPAKKLQPGERYTLHCVRSHHEVFLSPERLNNKEYVDGAQFLLFGSRQWNCALALVLFVAHFIFIHNLYHSPAYLIHNGYIEYVREKVIDSDHFSALYEVLPKEFIHINSVLVVNHDFDDTLCLRDKSELKKDDFKDAVQHLIGMDYSVELDEKKSLFEMYPEAYEYLINIKSRNQVNCPITMTMTGERIYDFDTSPIYIITYLSERAQKIKMTANAMISSELVKKSISGYVYGNELPVRNSIHGLVVKKEIKSNGNVFITLNRAFTPTQKEEVESIYYKIWVNIILAAIYLFTFIGFLIGWFKESGSSPSMPNPSAT